MLFDHVDWRVSDLASVLPLYDALLPAMGYSQRNADPDSVGYHRPAESGTEPFLWVVRDQTHRPTASRLAFAAQSREEVDRLSAIAHRAGALAFEAPALQPEYGPTYYAAFFEDAEGNKLEVCCRRRD